MKEYIIYGKYDCPYCSKIFDFMRERQEKFIYVIINNLEENLNQIKEAYNWDTVPIVVELNDDDNGEKIAKLIGGCDDAIKYFKEKE